MKIDFAAHDFDNTEIDAVNKVMNSGDWLASGPENEAFEKEFAEYTGAKYAICVNSGSSANLLALSSLSLSQNDRVLTSACGFPATYSPILHLGLQPSLVDYDISTNNIKVFEVIKYLHHVKAIILAHTLGNPVNIEPIVFYANILGIPVIEDCCEAVGTWLHGKSVGTFGIIGTFSFYPAHQMTALGGGGMVITNNETLYRRMKSMRDWGKMYDWDSDKGGNQTDYSSPIGYHRGYTYDTVGWNFKLPEANAAFGRVQLRKLDRFVSMRQFRYNYLRDGLRKIDDFMQIDEWPDLERISWFGYPITIRDGSKIKRNELGLYLESKGIKHRPFFAGNILRQPAFKSELADKFPESDKLMKDSLFIGCHTKIDQDNLDYMIKTIYEYVNSLNS